MLTVVIILCTAYIALFAYFHVGWRRARSKSWEARAGEVDGDSTITLLIPFSNGDEADLKSLLEDLDKQKNTQGLVCCLIDDRDEGASPLKLPEIGMTTRYQRNENERGKIPSLRKGMEIVDTEYVLTLDVDVRIGDKCLLVLRSYLSTQEDVDMVVLPVIGTDNGNPASRYALIDFMSLIGVTFSMLGHNRPVMANGAQLLFRASCLTWPAAAVSGDDIFALHAIKAAGGKIDFLMDSDLFAHTAMPRNWTNVVEQRSRWASKQGNYRDGDTLILGWSIVMINLALWVLLILGLFDYVYFYLFLSFLGIKAIMDFTFLYRVMSWSNHQRKLWSFPWVFVLNTLQYPMIFLYYKLFGFQWKGRKYR